MDLTKQGQLVIYEQPGPSENQGKKKAKKGDKECETYHLVQSNSINMDSEGAIEIKRPY